MKNSKKKSKEINEFSHILVKGARVHNLKNIDLNIPRDKLVVITGLSGSGKSSLAFDTLYAEGQRRYVESLSSYARQFLGKIQKPEVDYIKGIPPAIAIEQKVNTRNPRSTVGTSTEIYDYMKLLFARVGITYSQKSNQIVYRDTVSDVIDYLCSFPQKTKAIILSPIVKHPERTCEEHLQILMQQGYSRIEIQKTKTESSIIKIQEFLDRKPQKTDRSKINIVIDRLSISEDDDTISRMGDSLQTAFFEGNGRCVIRVLGEKKESLRTFSNRFEADGEIFEEPTVNMFSFNNPLGACPDCEGFGRIFGIDESLVVPNKSKSIFDDAIACWRGEKMQMFKNKLIDTAEKFDFPIHRPYFKLSQKEKELLWKGNEYFTGLHSFFNLIEQDKHKIQYRIILSRYRGKTICPSCRGTRLKKEAENVKVGGMSIHELVLMQISDLKAFFDTLELSTHQQKIAKRLLIEINSRLIFLQDVGLNYLTLNRLSSSLSGGESQRINLATSMGSSLVGSLYILDEPSIGLHPRDTMRLIKVLKDLRDLGNTVVVVEHDEDIIRTADQIIDIGPEAGRNGGEVVSDGILSDLLKSPNSLTTKYLSGKMEITVPKHRRVWNRFIHVENATENNLDNVSVKFPLNILTVVTGVSGSGKSSLVRDVLFQGMSREIYGQSQRLGSFEKISGSIKQIDEVEFVDQNPIGRSSRSNPVTYIKAYDDIRKLYSQQQAAKINSFKPGHFSFNVEGGRCDECQGDGFIKVEMQFMADVTLICESCNGKRFKDEVLDVKFANKNIFELLDMTVDEAIDFFEQTNEALPKRINEKIKLLEKVGLGYVKLGQPSSTLSGGESQRIKLASFLAKEHEQKQMLFIFDEPTTGLHFHDIRKLLIAFNALLDRGHTVVVIEHNAEIIKSADWIIDLGPEGGDLGGCVIAEGTPEEIAKCTQSYTGKFIADKLLTK